MPFIVSITSAIKPQLREAWVDGRLLDDDLLLVMAHDEHGATAHLIHDDTLDCNADDTVAMFSCLALAEGFKVWFLDNPPGWNVRAEIDDSTAQMMLRGWVAIPALDEPGPAAVANQKC